MENYSTLSRDRTFRKRGFTVVIFGLIAILGLYGILYSVENFLGGTQTQGESGSSYATISSGTRAWSELLSSNDYMVVRDRGRTSLPVEPISEPYGDFANKLDLNRETQTIVVLNGALPRDEANEVKTFIKSGGRLITDNPILIKDILDNRATIEIEGSTNLFANLEIEGLEEIEELEGGGVGSVTFLQNDTSAPLTVQGQSLNIALTTDKTRRLSSSAAIFRVGNGDVIALPDIGLVSNELLTAKDNALFSLRIAGATGSGVTFIEGVHGYSNATGFAGMPLSWRIAIVGLFVAFVVFGSAQGRRFGVGEEPDRNLGPRRIYFAHAIAQALKKSKG